MNDEPDFLPEDYRFTADLLRQHTAADRRDLFQAVCSNNLNVILAALHLAEKDSEVRGILNESNMNLADIKLMLVRSLESTKP